MMLIYVRPLQYQVYFHLGDQLIHRQNFAQSKSCHGECVGQYMYHRPPALSLSSCQGCCHQEQHVVGSVVDHHRIMSPKQKEK